MTEVRVIEASLPQELALDAECSCDCTGDGCNDDQGGCSPADASCGQDC